MNVSYARGMMGIVLMGHETKERKKVLSSSTERRELFRKINKNMKHSLFGGIIEKLFCAFRRKYDFFAIEGHVQKN